jgi:hypothetical protein
MRSIKVAILGLCLLLPSVSAFAHHAFAAEFDDTKPITVTGVVTKVELVNPHSYFYLDVKDADGNVVNWAFEGGAPLNFHRQGWRPNVGDVLTVEGFRAKNGKNLAASRTITLPDGRKVFGGTPTDGGPGSATAPGATDNPKK